MIRLRPKASHSADGMYLMIGNEVDVARADHVVDDFAELIYFVRFSEHAAEAKVLIAAHGCVGRVIAGNDRVHSRIDLD